MIMIGYNTVAQLCFIQNHNNDIHTDRMPQEHVQSLVYCNFTRATIQVSLDIVRATVQYFLVHSSDCTTKVSVVTFSIYSC